MNARSRLARRTLTSFALLVTATFLGVFVLGAGRHPSGSGSSLSAAELVVSNQLSEAQQLANGRTLFVESCSTCHGSDGRGSSRAPNLVGLGGATIDLWMSTGWMPLAEPTAQPARKPSKFDRAQTLEIVKYVTSLGPSTGPAIPESLDISSANVAQGFNLFALNCAPCHTITGAGDALASGIYAPPLHGVNKTIVWEAVRTGPGNMPRFGPGTLSPAQINGVVAYVVNYIQHPAHPGGIALGGVGPVAEGFIGLFVGVGACLLAAYWVGDRNERDDEPHEGAGHTSADLETTHG